MCIIKTVIASAWHRFILTCQLCITTKDLLCHRFKLQENINLQQNDPNSSDILKISSLNTILYSLENRLGHHFCIQTSLSCNYFFFQQKEKRNTSTYTKTDLKRQMFYYFAL